MSRIAFTFACEKPQRRIAVVRMESTAAGDGKRPFPESATKRARMLSAALPWSCWCAMARNSDSYGDSLRGASPHGP